MRQNKTGPSAATPDPDANQFSYFVAPVPPTLKCTTPINGRGFYAPNSSTLFVTRIAQRMEGVNNL